MYKSKNKLKNLIYIQDNKPYNEQTVKGLFRSIAEPVLEENAESLLLLRLEDKSKKDFNGILKRLEYSSASIYDFSDNNISENIKNVLKEKIWDKTEFIFILAERFCAVLIFDYEESEVKDFARIYTLYNSKSISDAFSVINSNSTFDLSIYQEKFRPDRRNNELLNGSIRKIVENLNDTNQEILISQIEKETKEDNSDLSERLEFISNKSNYVSHEIRNQLSICNLYSNIIEKQFSSMSFANKAVKKSVTNAVEYIQKSIKIAGNMLLELKSLKSADLREYNLKDLIETSMELAKVYSAGKDIKFNNQVVQATGVLVDENLFLAVLINLIKNAVESIQEKGEIIISAVIEDSRVKLIISNNGVPIEEKLKDKIFEERFTTKLGGSGLGLLICKKSLEEQFAQLKLRKSDDISTEFEITLLKV